MTLILNTRISNDYNCLHTFVTITAYKAYKLHVLKTHKLTLVSSENFSKLPQSVQKYMFETSLEHLIAIE